MPTTQNEGLAENRKPQAASGDLESPIPAAQAASPSLASIKAQIDAIPDADQRELIRKQVFGNPKPSLPKGAVPLNSLAGLACIFPGLKAHHK